MNVLAIARKPSEVARRKYKIELTDATPFGETRGSIRAVSNVVVLIPQPALASRVNKTKRSARVERNVGYVIILAVARQSSQYCQSRTLGDFL